jgi:hypothetical protein
MALFGRFFGGFAKTIPSRCRAKKVSTGRLPGIELTRRFGASQVNFFIFPSGPNVSKPILIGVTLKLKGMNVFPIASP